MNFKSIYFLLGYVFIVFLDLLFGYLNFHEYRLLTKPLIVISLMIHFGLHGKHLPKKTFQFTILALFFSLIGDIILLFELRSPSLFTLGLTAFLLAHLSYSVVFTSQRNLSYTREYWIILTAIVSFGVAIFLMVMENLGDFMVPVIIYIIAILVMAITSSNRKAEVGMKSYSLVLLGAIFFIISDSILAINKFNTPVPMANFWIMSTYAASQYLIVNGLLASNE
ncbi:MAG: lysoplasmalogenase [Arenibacter sp.]|uniref:lysoplasmalogenase n=1 Tax=Arenibacter TaxID=178469 RepID=UPI000A366382|nr:MULTISPECIES: lysoplasmalogenase [Arenibacter]MDX1328258.1 lysoplasmalogenase [Arenibacter sp.]